MGIGGVRSSDEPDVQGNILPDRQVPAFGDIVVQRNVRLPLVVVVLTGSAEQGGCSVSKHPDQQNADDNQQAGRPFSVSVSVSFHGKNAPPLFHVTVL
jgi:hypothetical protein